MTNCVDMTDGQLNRYLEEFFDYFKDGYEFEKFLKIYLEKLGLDEVIVTKRSNDGGIDLKAVRPGIGGFNGDDLVNYYIQAKCYNPNSTVPISKLRELKGVIPFGYKGILISTAKYSKKTRIEAVNDISKTVVLIDGKQLIESCIDLELGFVFLPKFSSSLLDNMLHGTHNSEINDREVVKKITANDLRARILSIPSDIFSILPGDKRKFEIVINNKKLKVNINRERKYFAGITAIYRELNLISNDGLLNPVNATWNIKDGVINISINNVEVENN